METWTVIAGRWLLIITITIRTWRYVYMACAGYSSHSVDILHVFGDLFYSPIPVLLADLFSG